MYDWPDGQRIICDRFQYRSSRWIGKGDKRLANESNIEWYEVKVMI